jgi:hypothetical protein
MDARHRLVAILRDARKSALLRMRSPLEAVEALTGFDVNADATIAERAPRKTLAQAAAQIVVADLSVSLDNVLAVAGAAREHPLVLVFGLSLAIVTMGIAASFIAPPVAETPPDSLHRLGGHSLRCAWDGLPGSTRIASDRKRGCRPSINASEQLSSLPWVMPRVTKACRRVSRVERRPVVIKRSPALRVRPLTRKAPDGRGTVGEPSHVRLRRRLCEHGCHCCFCLK